MKKIFAVLMALSLILTLGVSLFTATVSADEAKTWTGSITIHGANNVPVAGKTFAAYKILNAVAVDATNLDKGVIYSIPAEMQAFYNELLAPEDADDYVATIDDVVAYIDGLDAEGLQAFAVKALDVANDSNPTATVTAGDDDTEAVFENLPFGYYVIEDQGTATPISALMLKSTSLDVTLKADKPSIDKAIDGDTDGDVTTEDPVDYNTATIGESVPYILTSKVPDMTGYTAYTYTVTDTFSDGLTFNNDIAVTVDGVPYTAYDVTVNDQVVTIEFTNFIALKDKAGKDIKITYSATVNENAIIGVEGNPNTVNLTYSNNPQSNTTEKTPDDVVYTYLVDLIINKTDDKGAALSGAQFAVKDAEDNILATGTSDTNGKVEFTWVNGTGLKDGVTYTIEETMAPAGYNKAKDIVFTVTCTDPADDAANANCTWSSDNDLVTFTVTEGTADDYFETTIENTTGWLLPETGGIGTTIFYVVGGLLMVAAAILLVSKKRMNGYA